MGVIGFVELTILVFAVARVTRLITDDKIMLSVRHWVLNRSGEEGWFTYLIHCPWCTGVWVAAGMTTLTYLLPYKPWYAVLLFLAVAQAASMVLTFTPEITVNVRNDRDE